MGQPWDGAKHGAFLAEIGYLTRSTGPTRSPTMVRALGRGLRGRRVIETVRDFLDEVVPLAGASHRDVSGYSVGQAGFAAETATGPVPLADPAAFAGYAGEPGARRPACCCATTACTSSL